MTTAKHDPDQQGGWPRAGDELIRGLVQRERERLAASIARLDMLGPADALAQIQAAVADCDRVLEWLGRGLAERAPQLDRACPDCGCQTVRYCPVCVCGTQSAQDSAEAAADKPRARVFVDMDGVVVDFDRYREARGMTGDQIKATPGAYLEMQPIPGAIEAVRSVIGMGFEVWLATKPPTGVAHAYSDKAEWVFKHLPELKRRIIVTHDKGLLGGPGDFLCDDRPHKANCERFAGKLLRFVDDFHWPQALQVLRSARDERACLLDHQGGGNAISRPASGLAEACDASPATIRVPAEPSLGLLMSMAIRGDHGLSFPGYYDNPALVHLGVTHRQRLEAALARCRQLHEEVVGEGFYRPELEEQYVVLVEQSRKEGE